ncbi:MAG: acyl-CoA synthetase, partial [Actinomycetota bacterium]|nr:acyl-CoA synthetase [Actinomycetota bacterium]
MSTTEFDEGVGTGGIASIADIQRMEQIPLAERNLPNSTYAMLKAGTEIAPDAPALSFFLRTSDYKRPTVWTHRELLRGIHRAANTFRRLGIQRDDVVAFLLPNLPETHLVIWGAEAAGIAFAINPLLDSNDIRRLLSGGNVRWIVTLAPTPGSDVWQKVAAAAHDLPGLQGILTVSVAPYATGISRFVAGVFARLGRRSSPGVRVLRFERELAHANPDRLDFTPPGARDVASYFCTGGTTGLPKIAQRTHSSEVFDAWAMQSFVAGVFVPRKAVFCGLPLFHVNGQLVTGLAPWSQGAHIVMGTPQGYRGDGLLAMFWKIVAHYKIAAFSGVPTVYSTLMQQPIGATDISSVQFGMCGAAPMPEELFNHFQALTGIRILEAYGLTEAACVSSVNPPLAEPRIGSIGIRLPYQRMATAILDAEGTFVRLAHTDEIGTILLSGPNVFAGYRDSRHNDGVWVDHDEVRWLNTGDLARQDGDGYFWLTGRKKELIIRGGHNIDPATIEQALYAHPQVALAAAVGRPDKHSGEVPVAYVQLKPGAAVDADAILEFARGRIGERAAHPKAVHILAELPATAVGKIFKPALTILEIEDVVALTARETGTR